MVILPFYAALLALLFIALSVRTVKLRRKLKIAVGDRGDEQMLRAMRVHANFAEYVPLCLLLIYLVEAKGAPNVLVHLICLALVAGRLCHAAGVSKVNEDFRFRISGMFLTFGALGTSAAYLLWSSIGSLAA